MASDKIVAKIIENAEAEAAAILAEAKDKADLITQTRKRQGEADVAAMVKAGEADVAEINRRSQLMTRLAVRKNRLAVKRDIIDGVFAQVEEKLGELDKVQWEKLMMKIITEGVETGRETLKVPAADRDKYDGSQGLLKRINDQLIKAGLPGELTLSQDAADFKAGVLIEGELSDINGSFDGLIANARNTYEREVAQILFPTEV